MPVLILDGEEIAGAKQNRVLNTTVLLKEESETIIPVSCTEQGRWHYTSDKFSDSGVVTAHKVRLYKNLSVSQSLESGMAIQVRPGKGMGPNTPVPDVCRHKVGHWSNEGCL